MDLPESTFYRAHTPPRKLPKDWKIKFCSTFSFAPQMDMPPDEIVWSAYWPKASATASPIHATYPLVFAWQDAVLLRTHHKNEDWVV